MIPRASALGMGVDRVSRLLGGVGVRAMPDVGLDTMRPVESVCEVPTYPVVPRVAVGVFNDHRCLADGVEVTC